METLSWLFVEHFREYDAWPWARLNSVQKQYQEHPAFLVGEFLFIALTCLSFAHAWTVPDKEGRRRLKLLWVASFVVGVVNDYIFMLLPVVDNFWQAQAIVMLTPRMPLYIPCVYNAFMYWAPVAASRVFHHGRKCPVAEAALAGLLGGLLYAPYDVCGARFLWWTWHDSDPGVRGRWLGVPAGSTSWTMTFVFSFALLLRKASDMGWSQPRSLALACLSTPLMMVILNVFTLLGGDDIGAPDVGTVLACMITFGVIVLRELARPADDPRAVAAVSAAVHKVHEPEPAVFRIGLVTYFGILAATMATFSPEKQLSTGVHQTFGPCDATDWDLLGFQRNRYICKERYPSWYFGYDCKDALEGATGRWAHVVPWEAAKGSKDGTASWFTICGRPHESFQVWMMAEGALTLLGATLYTWMMSTCTKPGEAAAPPIVKRRNKLTAFGVRVKDVFDPIYAPLAERHWNVAVALLVVLECGVIWIAGQVLNAVYPPGNSGAYLQRAYDVVRSLPLSSRPYFPALMCGVVHFCVCGTYLALDAWRPPFFQALLRQRREAKDWDLGLLRTIASQVWCFATLAIPQFFIQFFRNGPSLYTAPWMAPCLDQCDQPLPAGAPSLVEFTVHLAFCLATFNFGYWYTHWQLHRNRSLYKHIHAFHHEYKQPFVTVGPHLHPAEFNAIYVFALAAPICCRAHPLTFMVWMSLNTIFGLEDHTGLEQTLVGWFFDMATLGHWGGSMGHNLHHAVVWGNYEPYLIFFDRLCGTEVKQEDAVTSKPEWERSPCHNADAGAVAKKDGASATQLGAAVAASEKAGEADLKAEADCNGLRKRSRNATPPPPPRGRE